MLFPVHLPLQTVTSSPEPGVRVWLAVHEDGVSVLEHNSIVRLFTAPYCGHWGTDEFISSSLTYVCFFFNHTQKPLVSHSYKNLMTFGGCRQDFMLVLGHSVGANSTRDKPTEKHLFSMDSSKVRHTHVCRCSVDGTSPLLRRQGILFTLKSFWRSVSTTGFSCGLLLDLQP